MSTPQDSDTTDDTAPVESVDGDEADVLMADPDDYHQAQRLRQIHRARQKVHDTLHEIDRWTTSSDHPKQERALSSAVSAYIAELEPLMQATDTSPDLADEAPWTSVLEYADNLGTKLVEPDDNETRMAHYVESMRVFRACNRYLADVKPLVEPDDTDEWEV